MENKKNYKTSRHDCEPACLLDCDHPITIRYWAWQKQTAMQIEIGKQKVQGKMGVKDGDDWGCILIKEMADER